MRKEIVYAIVFGGILGLIVAFGIWRVNFALSPTQKLSDEVKSSPTPRPEFIISLAKPEVNDVITVSPMEITGITKANAMVAVSGEESDYVTNAAGDGTFSESVNLVGGVNQILLTAFDEIGNPTQNKLLVVFSSEFGKILQDLITPAPAATETGDVDTVREKVEQKVSEALHKPKAYLGLITDISEGTIQIKTSDGEIQQIGTASDTVYIKTDPSAKTVGLKDIAIGDFIVAMGFKNGNAVLNAKRILSTSPLEITKKNTLLGKVSKVSKTDFVITQNLDQQEITITPNKTASYLLRTQDKFNKSKLTDLKEGSEVVVFGEPGEKSFSARTIFIVAVGS